MTSRLTLTVLVDNTTLTDHDYCSEAGLSFLIETAGKKILFDTGLSGLFLANAETMGFDLRDLDVLVLSHGHIDHTGGLATLARYLATATPDGIPSGRMVLLKGFDKKGFVFFTNYESRKAYELKKNNSAALTFYWPELYRQVRIEGKVNKINVKDSDIYFQARPRGSQISADASAQSHVVESRVELEKMAYEIEQKNVEARQFIKSSEEIVALLEYYLKIEKIENTLSSV